MLCVSYLQMIDKLQQRLF